MATTTKADLGPVQRRIVQEIEANGFDLNREKTQLISSVSRMHELKTRRANLLRLLELAGGDSGQYQTEEAAG